MDHYKNLVVDLDGSLVKSDTLLESLLLLIKQNVLLTVLLPFWLLKGKAAFKARIAEAVSFDARYLPYNEDVLAFVQEKKQAGCSVYLATGANSKIAQAVSDYLQIFDGIFASDALVNLTGQRKTDKLNQHFGENNYAYIGNSHVDLPVWESSSAAIVVSSSQQLYEKAAKLCPQAEKITTEKATLKDYLKAIRVHQWVKNVLIFVPVLTAHAWLEIDVVTLLAGFFSFSLAASSVYVLNDLLDLASDRQHPSKKNRPFASAKINLLHGLFLIPLLLLFTVLLLLWVPLPFIYALAVYYAITLAYSFGLKKVIMLDTVVLAILYTLRIIAGTLLIAVDFSFWLLAFSLFIFQSLALVKRYTELVLVQSQGQAKAIGRGYHASDSAMVAALGAASGYLAVLVFALYVNNPDIQVLYQHAEVLWLACPVLLYWISRVWLIAHRGQMHDDPIVFAVKDKQSLLVGAMVLAIFGFSL